MNKGSTAEIEAKHKLIKDFGEFNVIKVSRGCGSGFDFAVLWGSNPSKLLKVVEVKSTKGKYPHWEKTQKERIRRFCAFHGVPCEVWMRRAKGKGRKAEWEVKELE